MAEFWRNIFIPVCETAQ